MHSHVLKSYTRSFFRHSDRNILKDIPALRAIYGLTGKEKQGPGISAGPPFPDTAEAA